MTTWGADADQLDALAVEFGQAADRLDRDRVGVNARVHHAPWRGAHADRFRRDWDQLYLPHLISAAGFLHAARVTLAQNAAAQRAASSASGSSGGPGGLHSGRGMPGGVRDAGLSLVGLLALRKFIDPGIQGLETLFEHPKYLRLGVWARSIARGEWREVPKMVPTGTSFERFGKDSSLVKNLGFVGRVSGILSFVDSGVQEVVQDRQDGDGWAGSIGRGAAVGGTSAVGGWAGVEAGGVIGASIGSIFPGPGTVIGGAVGAGVGAFVGSSLGHWAGRELFH